MKSTSQSKWNTKEYVSEYNRKYRLVHGQKTQPKVPPRAVDDKIKEANKAFKLSFFDALDKYMVHYNTEQITNSNKLYQFIIDELGYIKSVRFSRLINEYRKRR